MLNFRFVSIFALIVLLTGCSVQSRQLDALQGLISGPVNPLEQAEWSANWNGSTFVLFAVNAPEETIFGYDRRIRVHFDGWNVTQVVGVLPNGDRSTIEVLDDELLYLVNDRLIARHECGPWTLVEVGLGQKRFSQACEGREAYTNNIDVNSDGLITRLDFLIHPEYTPLTMTSDN